MRACTYPADVEPTPDRFRLVMGHFATGVTVVTTLEGERPHGITVNALSSVSLDPPLVMVALDRGRRITPLVRSHGRFAVNILGEGQQALSDCFAGAPVVPDRESFCGAAWTPGTGGLPLLDGAIAVLECTVTAAVPAGDHDLFVARVDAVTADGPDAMPLLYYRRRYLRIERAKALDLEGKPER
jgi:flavin reductase (DIM6/NTAB) family NADH-FMN oxidoreductase RutF